MTISDLTILLVIKLNNCLDKFINLINHITYNAAKARRSI
jgi:hypothetical protein